MPETNLLDPETHMFTAYGGTSRSVRVDSRMVLRLSAMLLTTVVVAFMADEARAAGEFASLDDGLRAAFEGASPEGHPSLAVLQSAGMRYRGYAVAERLPRTGAYLAEVRLSRADKLLRYPVKVVHGAERGWELEWTPRSAYAKALVAFLRGDVAALPDRYLGTWAETERVPALPLVVREDSIVSPFGVVPSGGGSGVEPPEALGKHVVRWVDSVLERDDAAAGIDLFVTAETPWIHVTRALFAAASAGLFRVYVVVRRQSDSTLASFTALAPVFESGRAPEGASSLIVGVDAAEPPQIRVDVGGELLDSIGDCKSGVSICSDNPAAFAERLPELVRDRFEGRAPSISHVMVAASGEVPFGDVITYAVQVPGALGIPGEKLFLGHIGAEKTEGGRGGSR